MWRLPIIVSGRRGRRAAAVLFAAGVACLPWPGHAAADRGFSGALSDGSVSADLRYRFEYVDQSNTLKDAAASTLRTRLGYRTGNLSGIGAYLEFEDVRVVGGGEYNSTRNGKTQYAVVLDPPMTEVNQAYLDIGGSTGTGLKLGRQRIIYDNARFVGDVGWRQNDQTFDGVFLSDTASPNLQLRYAYVYNVNTITGTDVGVRAHLINASYDRDPVKLTGYAYLIGFNDTPGASNKTLGLRLTWSKSLAQTNAKIRYTAEYAKQDAYADGDPRINADYYFAEVSALYPDKTLGVGYEVLGSDNYSGFETPFATKHAFNGWADQFTDTPVDGLKDLYLAVGVHPDDSAFTVVYHRFSAQRGGLDYGSEVDVLLSRRFGRHLTLLAKYAHYEADRFSVDTDKAWAQGDITF